MVRYIMIKVYPSIQPNHIYPTLSQTNYPDEVTLSHTNYPDEVTLSQFNYPDQPHDSHHQHSNTIQDAPQYFHHSVDAPQLAPNPEVPIFQAVPGLSAPIPAVPAAIEAVPALPVENDLHHSVLGLENPGYLLHPDEPLNVEVRNYDI